MAKLNTGDKFVFGRCKRNKDLIDITVGKVYVVADRYSDGDLVFIADAGDRNFSLSNDATGLKPTKIVD
jgi:hypothetical protein